MICVNLSEMTFNLLITFKFENIFFIYKFCLKSNCDIIHTFCKECSLTLEDYFITINQQLVLDIILFQVFSQSSSKFEGPFYV